MFNGYEQCIQKIDSENEETILIGDFNADWVDVNPTTQTKALKDITNEFQFEQFIDEASRVTESTSSIIDLVLSNKLEIIIRTDVDHKGISDHSLIHVCRKISIPRKKAKIIKTR